MKKVGLAITAALLISCAAIVPTALGSSTGPAVRVQIRTLKKTIRNVVVHGEKRAVRKDGGACSGNSGAGALDAATHGKWRGTYSSKFRDFFVTSILGVTPKAPYYWFVFVNGKEASTGVCGIKLRAHETILFKIEK